MSRAMEGIQLDNDGVDERTRQECENENAKDDWQPLPKETQEGHNSRIESSNRSWSRKSSPNRGEYLKMDDELMTISRGGARMTIVKSTAHHAPTITIGHLDEAGRDILDEKLRGTSTIEEIVEFFKNYLPQTGIKFDIVRRKSRSSERDNMMQEEATGNETWKTTKPKNREELFGANSLNNKNSNNIIDQDNVNKENKNVDQNKKAGDDGKNGKNEKNGSDENIDTRGGNIKNKNLNNLPSIRIEDTSDTSKHCMKQDNDSKHNMIGENEGQKKKETNVFDILEADYLKRMIPYMHPDSKKHTFRFFIDKVHEVCDGKGLLETDVLDVMQFRMGGSYLAEMKDLRCQDWELVCIEDFYLQKDLDYENEKQKKASILEESRKMEESVEMMRKKQKDAWGVTISYSKSSECGLQLVLGHVEENSPAWRCGLKAGDAIVTVNEWVITLMDRPEVAVHLLQASANSVKLGIVKCDVGYDPCHAVGVF